MKSIFVSSTFRDMHGERDILHKRVMPELNEYASRYGESVSFCDLRWGVDTEDLESEEGSRKVLSVCLDEIDRCHPYMLVILGERYGWIPEPETMKESIKNRAGVSLEDLEKSVTALEIEYGALGDAEQLEHTLFYFREFDGPAPEEYGREDLLHEEKLKELKERIRRLAGDRLRTYTISWDEEKKNLLGMETFAEQVTADIKQLMEEEWKVYAALTPYERDRRFQWDYARQKAEQFQAREDLAKGYIEKLDQGQTLLAVSGAAGSGKSTLMGWMAVRLQEEGKEVLPIFCGSTTLCNDAMDLLKYIVCYIEDRFSLKHFETEHEKPESFGEELLRKGIEYAGDRDRPGKDRTEEDLWVERLAEMCALYTEKADGELILLVDAVDQLFADEVRDRLRFIPPNLSAKVKMMCSYLDSFHPRYYGAMKGTETIQPLTVWDRRAVAEGILHSQGRELSRPVMERILTKEESDSPLYLSLAVQRLVMMDQREFKEISARGDGIEAITEYQKEMVDRLPEDLERLCVELIYTAAEKLETIQMEHAARYIAASRYGLREKDLDGIFTAQGMKWSSLDFTRFLRYMRSFFLLRDDGRWDFTHRSIREGIRKSAGDMQKFHREILKHLKGLEEHDRVRIEEILYHCQEADDRRYFVHYISKYEDAKAVIRPAAKTVSEGASSDGGEWLCRVIRDAAEYGAGHDFVAFLHYELDEKFSGSQRKRLDATLKLAKRLAEKKETDESLCDLSVSYAQVGDDYKERGEYNDSLIMYKMSLAIDKKLLEWKRTSQSQRNLGLSYIRVGDMLTKQKKFKEAQEMYERSLEIAKELASEDESIQNQLNLGHNYERVGHVLVIQGGEKNLERAREIDESLLEIFKELAEKEGTYKSLLGFSYGELGYTLEKQGGKENLERAQEMYERSLEIFKELAEKKGTNQSLIELGLSYGRLGRALEKQGEEPKLKRAQEIYAKIRKIFKELMVSKETSGNLREESIIYRNAGEILEGLGGKENLETAREMYEKSLEIAEKLAVDEETALNLLYLSKRYEEVGNICVELGGDTNLRIAGEMYKSSLKVREELAVKEGTSEDLLNLRNSYARAGDVLKREGARRFLRRGNKVISRQVRKEILETARKMYERGLEIAKEVAMKNRNGLSLLYLSYSYENVGDICVEQGGEENLRIARKMYKRSLEIKEEKEAGNDWLGMSIGYRQVGELFGRLGGEENLGFAREMQERALELKKDLAAREGTSSCLSSLSFQYERVGDICVEQGGEENWIVAWEMYKQSVEIQEVLVEREETNKNLRDLNFIYEKAGRILHKLGKKEYLEVALKLYQKNAEVLKKLEVKERTSESSRHLSFGYEIIGNTLKRLGGEENLREALEMYERSLEIDKGRAQYDWRNIYEQMGDVYIDLGGAENLRKALEMYGKSLKKWEELIEEERSSSKRGLSIIYIKVGDIYEKQGGKENWNKALEMYEKSLGIAKEMVAKKEDSENQRELSVSYDKIGGILEKQGGEENLRRALKIYQKNVAIWKKLAGKLTNDEVGYY